MQGSQARPSNNLKKANSFKHMLKRLSNKYEIWDSQFFKTTTSMQSGPDVFNKSRLFMTFLTRIGVFRKYFIKSYALSDTEDTRTKFLGGDKLSCFISMGKFGSRLPNPPVLRRTPTLRNTPFSNFFSPLAYFRIPLAFFVGFFLWLNVRLCHL